jgi:cysteinyl-tRNA synthetase
VERALEDERFAGLVRATAPRGEIEAVTLAHPREYVDALMAARQTAQTRFAAAMDDDFNTAAALGHIYDLVKAINTARDAGVGAQALGRAQEMLKSLTGVLGLRLQPKQTANSDAEPFIALLIELRSELRQARQWALADAVRDGLAQLGVVLEDTREGTLWSWQR